MHLRLFKSQIWLLGIFLMLLTRANASTVHGAVTDPLGASVLNARVELLLRNKVVAETRTDSQGTYSIDTAPSGRYRLRITAPSFEVIETESFYLEAGSKSILRDVLLHLKNISTEVVVTATGVPLSAAQEGSSIRVLTKPDYLEKLDVFEPLSSIPGTQITQTGQRGGTTSLFLRGGNSNANKVVLDGVPVNDIGGDVEFGNLALSSLDHIEIFRGPNSVLYGADALAGVVSLTTQRGSSPLPQISYSADGGTFGTLRQEATIGGFWKKLDYFSSASRFDTSNSSPNSKFHNGTFAANIGWSPSETNTFRVTVRRVATGLGLPNAIDLFGVPDNAQTANHDTFVSATYENQPTPKWHNLIRYGASRLDNHFNKPSPVGIFENGFEFVGLPVTIKGANGFSASGQAFLTTADCCPDVSLSTANRDFVYAQTDYRFNPHVVSLFGFRYEAERGTSQFASPSFSSSNSIDRRNMSFLLETHGDIRNVIFYSAGGAIERNEVFGVEATPRLSLAYYPFHARNGFFQGTKLKFSFGKGVKEPDIFDETSSLFDLLKQQTGGDQLIQKFGIKPIGAERSRSYDFGIQQALGSRALVDLTLFHNQFSNEIEFVSNSALPQLGVPSAVAAATGFGATVNSADFRAEGVEAELQFRISRSLTARGGYTYLDARVQRSFSSDALSPAVNPAFPDIPIGAFGPLVGGRPFRRAPHTGFLAVSYTHSRWSGLLQGTFVGRRDDSTFLLFSDADFGNSLLLPNRNLDGAYQKVDLSGSFAVNQHIALTASMENLLNQRYEAAFGFPSLPFTIRSGVRITWGGESWHWK